MNIDSTCVHAAIFFLKQEKLPPTDSRLRPDQRCLENGEYELANAEKLRLEQRQRQVIYASVEFHGG